MNRRKRLVPMLVAALLLLGGALLRAAYRNARQERLNRRLILAIKHTTYGHSQAAEVLACLQSGADPNAYDKPSFRDPESPSSLLPALRKMWEKLWSPRRVETEPGRPMQSALFLALEGEITDRVDCFDHYADPAVVKLLVQYGADVRGKDRYGRTPLVAAFQPIPDALFGNPHAQDPHWECELILIAAGADPEARADVDLPPDYAPQGYTALMAGGGAGDAQVSEALVRHGARVDAANRDGRTALICRAQNNDVNGCRFLLDHGADVNHADEYGKTALMEAANKGNAALVSLLLQRGADVNRRAQGGITALYYAWRHIPVMRLLLQGGAAVDAQDEDGWTVLMAAAREEDKAGEATVRLLLESGASVHIRDKQGRTLYQVIKIQGDIHNRRILDLLKRHGMQE